MNSNPPRSRSTPNSPLPSSTPYTRTQSTMAIQAPPLAIGTSRRINKPSQMQTSQLPPISASSPSSAVDSSSIASDSQQTSPGISPQDSQIITNNSSVQVSPEGPRGRDAMDYHPAPLELPEPLIISRKPSQNAMNEYMHSTKSPGLIRRLSNKASKFAGRRRQSSITSSRDHSTGPVIMRRRSDSNSTAPDGAPRSAFADSEDDVDELSLDGLNNSFGGDGLRDFSANASMSGSTIVTGSFGPVIPSILLQGTSMTKVTKKKKKLRLFRLDIDKSELSWDKGKSLHVDDIKEIRVGAHARNYREDFGVPVVDEAKFCTILYADPDRSKGRPHKTLHMIAADEQLLEMWTSTLDAISKHRHDFMTSLSSFNDKAVETYWRREMSKQFGDRPRTEDDEEIDLVGVERLCRSLHINVSPSHLRERFAKADATRTGRLNFTEFQEFVRLMKKREDISGLYRKAAVNPAKGITFDEFLVFLKEVQCEDIDSDRQYWETAFNKFVRRSKSKEQALQDSLGGEVPVMNESALTAFLTSTYNLPIANRPAEVSLDRPLQEYYISSSHNTYLLGRQIAGHSSVEAYVSALVRGCRCVEVDCWNGNNGQPVVMHGNTMTSKVSFSDVMTTIAKYAFDKSEFPLIISLEVHCNPEQQTIMADIIRKTCGEMLVTEPLDPDSTELPSPSQLKRRILIKVKKPRVVDEAVVLDSTTGRKRTNSIGSPYIKPTGAETSATGLLQSAESSSPHTRAARFQSKHKVSSISEHESTSSSTSDSDSFTDEPAKSSDGGRKKQTKKKTSNIIEALGKLGVYSSGITFNGFEDPDCKTYNHVFSFHENTFAKHSRTIEDKYALQKHNMRHFMRVYPRGTRFSSSNFDPVIYWRQGVQMAALNWQTFDLGMQINDAMFAAGTDRTGYVLKSNELRENKVLPNIPEGVGLAPITRERKFINFSIDLISAQQLMRPKALAANRSVDPYVEVEVYHADEKSKDSRGVVATGGLDASDKDSNSGLGAPHRRRSRIVQGNGFNPVFNSEFNFELATSFPDLVFVRFTVRVSPDGQTYSDRGPALATYTAKLSSLKQGYRTLPLLDTNGEQFLFSTLFCRVKIEPATSIYINGSSSTEPVSVLKGLGRAVFNRGGLSTRPSMDSLHHQ